MKYKCERCGNDNPCFFEYRTGVSPHFCPYSQNSTASWVEKDKPDPDDSSTTLRADGDSFVPQDMGIVKQIKAAIHCHDKGFTPFRNERDILRFLKSWGKTIQAGIQKNRGEIKEVDRRRYNSHLDFLRERDYIYEKIEAVRKETQNQLGQVAGYFRGDADQIVKNHENVLILERKVGELEKILDEIPHGEPTEDPPQPVAYAWDKDHKAKHPLIPGVSVCEISLPHYPVKDYSMIFHHVEGCDNAMVYGYLIKEGLLGTKPEWSHKDHVVWLRNLDFPPGGDK